LANHTALVTKNGREVPIEDSAAPIRNSVGNIVGAVLVFHDVAEKRGAQEALRESENRYRSLFEQMTEGFALHEIIVDEKGVPCDYRFLEINSAFEKLTGLRRDDVIGKTLSQVLPSDDLKWVRLYGEVALTGNSVRFDSYSPALEQHYEVFAYRPMPGQFATLFTNVTERKRAEVVIRESEERLRLLGDNLPNSTVYQFTRELDGTPRFLYISAGVERLIGVKAEDVLKDAEVFLGQILPSEQPALQDAERLSARDLSVFDREFQIRLPDGQLRWMHVCSRPRRLSDGRVAWDSVQTDITERKRAEEMLLRYEILAAHSRDVMLFTRYDDR
jgi:PAS domain S-box-containing protein